MPQGAVAWHQRLSGQFQQELICRTVVEVDEPVEVADFALRPAEAWRLLDKLEDLVTEGTVEWPVEGF